MSDETQKLWCVVVAKNQSCVLSVVGDTPAFQAEMIGSIPIGRSNLIINPVMGKQAKKMKTVVNISGLMPDGNYDSITIQKVPDDWMQCSVSGEWLPRLEFGLRENGCISRTNCSRTYKMKNSDYTATKAAFENLKKSHEYKSKEEMIKTNANLMSNTMRIADLIESLQKLDPDDFVCIDQGGYYAVGDRAEIFFPSLVGRQSAPFGDRSVYSIGYSGQNC